LQLIPTKNKTIIRISLEDLNIFTTLPEKASDGGGWDVDVSELFCPLI